MVGETSANDGTGEIVESIDVAGLGRGTLIVPADDAACAAFDPSTVRRYVLRCGETERGHAHFRGIFLPDATKTDARTYKFKSGLFEMVLASAAMADAGFSRLAYVDDEGRCNGSAFNPEGSALCLQKLYGNVVFKRMGVAKRTTRVVRQGAAKKARAGK
jgi:hypothetical protein